MLLALNVDVVVPAIETLFGVQFLAKDVYYISELPSDLQSARRRYGGGDVAAAACSRRCTRAGAPRA